MSNSYINASPLMNCAKQPQCDEQVMRQPEVEGWLVSLSYATERLLGQSEQLGDLLSSVLGPDDPAAGESKQVECGCKLAARIQEQVTRLGYVEARINNVLRRLEI